MNVRKVFSQVVLTSFTAFALCACGGGGGDTTPHAASSNTPASHAQAEVNANVGAPAGYALVWAEEFNGEGLPDSSKWSYDTEMNKAGW